MRMQVIFFVFREVARLPAVRGSSAEPLSPSPLGPEVQVLSVPGRWAFSVSHWLGRVAQTHHVAWCHLSEGYLLFRLDRQTQATTLVHQIFGGYLRSRGE